MEGQKSLRFHQKDLHLGSEDELKSFRFSWKDIRGSVLLNIDDFHV